MVSWDKVLPCSLGWSHTLILLPQPLEHWHYMYIPPCPERFSENLRPWTNNFTSLYIMVGLIVYQKEKCLWIEFIVHFLFFLETESQISHAGIELSILLSPCLKCWDYRCKPHPNNSKKKNYHMTNSRKRTGDLPGRAVLALVTKFWPFPPKFINFDHIFLSHT